MLLSDRDLANEIRNGRLGIEPAPPVGGIQSASIDVRLSDRFRVFDSHRTALINPSLPDERLTTEIQVTGGEPFVLHPGQFVLGATLERVSLGDSLAARLEGKSSLGRLGLLVHSTAGFIDPGFAGQVTLELSNVNTLPIALWPGMRIGQLCVFATSTPVNRPYGTRGLGSRYQHQSGPTASLGVAR